MDCKASLKGTSSGHVNHLILVGTNHNFGMADRLKCC